ncbi:MAG: TldD/PmbA family protein [Candidatus Natronoplasma sp.]
MAGKRFDRDFLKIAVETAVKSGADEAIAKLVEEKKHQIRFSNSSIDVNKEWENFTLDIFISKKPRLSLTRKIDTLSIQDPEEEKIKKRVKEKVKLLDALPKSKLYWGMDESSHRSYPSLDLYDSRMEGFHKSGPKLVKKMIDSALDSGAKKAAGVLHSGVQKIGLLTSRGNGGSYKSSFCRGTIRAFHDDESSGQGLVVTRDLSRIEKKFEKAGKKAGRLAERSVGPEQGDPGTYDLIMSPTVAANLFGNLLNGTNPIMMISGMSCLKGRMNDKIGPEELSITDDPLIEEGLNSRPFDDEGTASKSTKLVEDGEFTGLIHNTSTAKFWRFLKTIKLRFWERPETTSNSTLTQMGMTDTEENPKVLLPTPSNYRFEPGSYSLKEMISESSRPTIYLTSNWYTRFTNMAEGEFSTVPRDAAFLIENGEIKKPIRNLRLKGNLVDLCENMTALGKDVKQVKWWEVNTPTFIPHIKTSGCEFTKAKEKGS